MTGPGTATALSAPSDKWMKMRRGSGDGVGGQALTIRQIFGCRAAAFLQKLPWRREAKSGDRFGLLPC
jgi:hypothetical protein